MCPQKQPCASPRRKTFIWFFQGTSQFGSDWEGLPLNFNWIGRALDEYRAISWKGMEYINVITVCLGRSLSYSNVMAYRGLSWNSMKYNVITVCLGRSLRILEYNGITRNSVEWPGTLLSRSVLKVAEGTRVLWNIEEHCGIALKIM